MCPTPELRPTMPANQADISELWVRPVDIARQDLFYGPWGRELAPKPGGTYRFVRPKSRGMNPGMTVLDTQGRKWSVKQAPHDAAASGGTDRGRGVAGAVGGRLPSAAGLLSARVHASDTFGVRSEPGGRFRLDHEVERSRLVGVATESVRRHPSL